MNGIMRKRLNQAFALIFMLAALVIALIVGLSLRQKGESWPISILFGALIGVYGSYFSVLLVMASVALVRKVSRFFRSR